MSQPSTSRYFTEPAADDPHARYPCGTCQRIVGVRNKAIQCEVCNFWNHIGCDGILPYDYDKIKNFLKLKEIKSPTIVNSVWKMPFLSKNYQMMNLSPQ